MAAISAPRRVSHGFERLGLIEYPARRGRRRQGVRSGDRGRRRRRRERRGRPHDLDRVDDLHEVASALEATLGEAEGVKLAWRPQLRSTSASDDAGNLMKLVDTLEDDDDVQTVWGNYEVSDEVMEKLA